MTLYSLYMIEMINVTTKERRRKDTDLLEHHRRNLSAGQLLKFPGLNDFIGIFTSIKNIKVKTKSK